jgi:hypothetical protein
MRFRPSFDGMCLEATGALAYTMAHDGTVEGCKKRLLRSGLSATH